MGEQWCRLLYEKSCRKYLVLQVLPQMLARGVGAQMQMQLIQNNSAAGDDDAQK
jgi:hypothetical protein